MSTSSVSELPDILAIYQLQWEEEGNIIRGTRKESRYRPIRKYLWLGFLVVLIGVAFIIAGSVFIGLGTIVASGFLFRTYWQLTRRQEEANNRRFEINEREVHVREGFQTRKIPLSQVRELKYQVEEKLDVHIGVVAVVTERDVVHPLLEVFGDDPREVRDHIVVLAQHLGGYCFEPDE